MITLYAMVVIGAILFVLCASLVTWSYWHEYRINRIRSTPTPIPEITLSQKLELLYPPTRNLKGSK